MALPGETIALGAPDTCPSCGTQLKLRVLRSGGGYYIGTMCCCGPYSRESGYYRTREEAQDELDSGIFGR
jgi:hypothetical protein